MVTKRKYQYDKPWCLIEHDSCTDCFESIDNNYKGCSRCDKCSVAIEHEKEIKLQIVKDNK